MWVEIEDYSVHNLLKKTKLKFAVMYIVLMMIILTAGSSQAFFGGKYQ